MDPTQQAVASTISAMLRREGQQQKEVLSLPRLPLAQPKLIIQDSLANIRDLDYVLTDWPEGEMGWLVITNETLHFVTPNMKIFHKGSIVFQLGQKTPRKNCVLLGFMVQREDTRAYEFQIIDALVVFGSYIMKSDYRGRIQRVLEEIIPSIQQSMTELRLCVKDLYEKREIGSLYGSLIQGFYNNERESPPFVVSVSEQLLVHQSPHTFHHRCKGILFLPNCPFIYTPSDDFVAWALEDMVTVCFSAQLGKNRGQSQVQLRVWGGRELQNFATAEYDPVKHPKIEQDTNILCRFDRKSAKWLIVGEAPRGRRPDPQQVALDVSARAGCVKIQQIIQECKKQPHKTNVKGFDTHRPNLPFYFEEPRQRDPPPRRDPPRNPRQTRDSAPPTRYQPYQKQQRHATQVASSYGSTDHYVAAQTPSYAALQSYNAVPYPPQYPAVSTNQGYMTPATYTMVSAASKSPYVSSGADNEYDPSKSPYVRDDRYNTVVSANEWTTSYAQETYAPYDD